jgi:hypothetical protein
MKYKRKAYTGINCGKNSRKPSGGMLTSQYADLKGLTVRTIIENLDLENTKRLLIPDLVIHTKFSI